MATSKTRRKKYHQIRTTRTFADNNKRAWELVKSGEAKNLKEAWKIIKGDA